MTGTITGTVPDLSIPGCGGGFDLGPPSTPPSTWVAVLTFTAEWRLRVDEQHGRSDGSGDSSLPVIVLEVWPLRMKNVGAVRRSNPQKKKLPLQFRHEYVRGECFKPKRC